MPEMGYQEVYLARAFRRLGHSVRVFCSTEAAPSGKHLGRKYAAGLSSDPVYGYEVLRSKPLFTASSNVVAKGIAAQVESYFPDVVVFIAVAKMFRSGLIRCKGLVDVRFVAVFGDSASYVSRSTAKARFRAKLHDLVFWAIKNLLYRRFFFVVVIVLSQIRPKRPACSGAYCHPAMHRTLIANVCHWHLASIQTNSSFARNLEPRLVRKYPPSPTNWSSSRQREFSRTSRSNE